MLTNSKCSSKDIMFIYTHMYPKLGTRNLSETKFYFKMEISANHYRAVTLLTWSAPQWSTYFSSTRWSHLWRTAYFPYFEEW